MRTTVRRCEYWRHEILHCCLIKYSKHASSLLCSQENWIYTKYEKYLCAAVWLKIQPEYDCPSVGIRMNQSTSHFTPNWNVHQTTKSFLVDSWTWASCDSDSMWVRVFSCNSPIPFIIRCQLIYVCVSTDHPSGQRTFPHIANMCVRDRVYVDLYDYILFRWQREIEFRRCTNVWRA